MRHEEKYRQKKWFGKITLDMDSTVRGVYGSQEGAEKWYNHKKKGQKSYHPLLCFTAENRNAFTTGFGRVVPIQPMVAWNS